MKRWKSRLLTFNTMDLMRNEFARQFKLSGRGRKAGKHQSKNPKFNHKLRRHKDRLEALRWEGKIHA